MIWQKTAPTEPGVWWVRSCGTSRLVRVWGYSPADRRLFTNEDGGAPLGDAMYADAWWAGPVQIPQPEEPR